jgi:hypothetical protein
MYIQFLTYTVTLPPQHPYPTRIPLMFMLMLVCVRFEFDSESKMIITSQIPSFRCYFYSGVKRVNSLFENTFFTPYWHYLLKQIFTYSSLIVAYFILYVKLYKYEYTVFSIDFFFFCGNLFLRRSALFVISNNYIMLVNASDVL